MSQPLSNVACVSPASGHGSIASRQWHESDTQMTPLWYRSETFLSASFDSRESETEVSHNDTLAVQRVKISRCVALALHMVRESVASGDTQMIRAQGFVLETNMARYATVLETIRLGETQVDGFASISLTEGN